MPPPSIFPLNKIFPEVHIIVNIKKSTRVIITRGGGGKTVLLDKLGFHTKNCSMSRHNKTQYNFINYVKNCQ
jgi:hypothetical protein